MPFGKFQPPQNFLGGRGVIGAKPSKKYKTHKSGQPSSNSGRSGVKTNHGSGIPQRKSL